MPDSLPARSLPATLAAPPSLRPRWVSPLLRRILLVNALPLALLVAGLLYLDQYQNGLLEAEVLALREQARIYAGALGESAVRTSDPANPVLLPELAKPLLRRLTDPTPNAQAILYAADGPAPPPRGGRAGAAPPPPPPPRPPAQDRGVFLGLVEQVYDRVLNLLPHDQDSAVQISPDAAGPDWQPDAREVRISSPSDSRELPPYIRRQGHRLLVTVAEPVERSHHTVGIVVLTRAAREVDNALFTIRMSILSLTVIALVLTVALSWYLSRTIARPLLRLARAAHDMREGRGRAGTVSRRLLGRRDEIGELAQALSESATALWTRMDAIERFAADVAHEIKNPLTSIRSAIETLRRIEDQGQQRRLLAIISEDVIRLDRLISDISDASRVDAELSRTMTEPVDVARMLALLAEIHEATHHPEDGGDDVQPSMVLDAPAAGLMVLAVEGRLVQVLRNLIGNALSFSPRSGTITLRAAEAGASVEIAVEDDGPGIPEARLEHVFDRFYTERPPGEQFGKHSGLGLSISRQIVEALKGQISAENRRGPDGSVVGARFVVRLPKA